MPSAVLMTFLLVGCLVTTCQGANFTAEPVVDVALPVPVPSGATATHEAPAAAAAVSRATSHVRGFSVFMFLSQGVWYSGWFKSLQRSVQAASIIPQMSTLIAAVTAAGVAQPLASSATTWTILAPTNPAFEQLLERLDITAEQLLNNRDLLVTVLSYHVIPTAAVNSAQLVNGQAYPTALQGATVTVRKSAGGTVRIVGAGNPTNPATVIAQNIRAGRSIIHVIDQVLLPPQ